MILLPSIGGANISNIINQTTTQANKNSLQSVESKLDNAKDDKELLEACQEFESLFVHMMLKEMRSTIPENGLIEKSTGREIFEDMYDQKVAENIAKSERGIGLAQVLYRQMKHTRGNL